jgi:hypothetical protein
MPSLDLPVVNRAASSQPIMRHNGHLPLNDTAYFTGMAKRKATILRVADNTSAMES